MTLPISAGDKIAAVGWFKSGKTHGMRKIAEATPAAIIFDPRGEFDASPWTATSVAEAPKVLQAGARHVSVVGGRDEFPGFCRLALQLKGWFVGIDEINMAVKGTSAASVPPELDDLWRLGHKDGITVAYTTHRLAEVPAILRMVEHLLQFRQVVQVDLEYLRSQHGQEFADRVEELPPRLFYYLGPDRRPVKMNAFHA